MSSDPSNPTVAPLVPEARENSVEENQCLVQAIVEGDRAAEQEFALRYMRPIRAMLLARSRKPDLASDLLQETMMAALCSLRKGLLRDPAKLTPFVVAVARNVLNSHFRGTLREPESLEFPDNLPDLHSSIDTIEAQQREKLAQSAIAGLDPLDKQILQMTLVEGFKPGIIAKLLHLKPEIVRQRKVRATRRVIDFVRSQSQTHSVAHFISGIKK